MSGIAFVVYRRRRRQKGPPLTVLATARSDSNEEFVKAELAGSQPQVWRRFGLARKSELEAESGRKNTEPSVIVAELECREKIGEVLELDGHAKPPAELSQAETSATIVGSEAQAPVPENIPLPRSPTNEPSPFPAGPLPAASDLYPAPQTKEAAVGERVTRKTSSGS